MTGYKREALGSRLRMIVQQVGTDLSGCQQNYNYLSQTIISLLGVVFTGFWGNKKPHLQISSIFLGKHCSQLVLMAT